MKRYIALLRGVNVSGKNKIPMGELKVNIEKLGFSDVKTYLNSGNVVFSCGETDKKALSARLEALINERFGVNVPVFVVSREELEDILSHAPAWWGTENKEVYDNLIFIFAPATFHAVYEKIGAPKEGLERIFDYKDAVFWSFDRKNYQKTNWWSKTASGDIGGCLTIRTAGTVRKICAM